MTRGLLNDYSPVKTIAIAMEVIKRGRAITADGWHFNGGTHIKFCGFATEDTDIGKPIPYAKYGQLVGEAGAAIAVGDSLGVDNVGRLVGAPATVGNILTGVAITAASGVGKEFFFDFKLNWLQPSESPASVQDFWVDPNRTDVYTPTGSIFKPFLTIDAATAAIVARADNAVTLPYTVIIATDVFAGGMIINSALIQAVTYKGVDNKNVRILGDVVCIANNDTLDWLKFSNLTFCGDVNIIGASNATTMNNIIFSGCKIEPAIFGGVADKTLTLKNFKNLHFENACEIRQNIAIENISAIYEDGLVVYSNTNTAAIVSNNGNNSPAAFAGIVRSCRYSIWQITPTLTPTTDTVHTNSWHSKLAVTEALTLVEGVTVTYFEKDYLSIVYDTAVHLLTQAAHPLGLLLPDNVVIIRAWYDVITTFTSGGADAATIAIHAEGANDIVNAAAISAGPGNIWDAGLHEGIEDGAVANAIKMNNAAGREVTLTVAGGQDLINGKLVLFLETAQSQ